MTDDYQGRLDYLYSRLNYERVVMPADHADLRLGRMRRILKRLGDPQHGLNLVHIAGTKGKGSTATMIATALSESGKKVGLFCSPHLHRIEERFQIDGRDATPGTFVALVDQVRAVVDELDVHDPHFEGGGATFFEITTAMGLLHFATQAVDVAVIEVGLGGRLDSTNVVHPRLAVLTTISFDHTRQLGNTLERIATEKAGIIKRGRPVVCGVRSPEALAAIEGIASQRRATLRTVERDFGFEYIPPDASRLPGPGVARVRTWRRDWGDVPLGLHGPHQALNASVALATLDVLAEQGVGIDPTASIRGIERARMPARVEVISNTPWLVIDGAHNVASAEALAETLARCFPKAPATLVFGTTREKDLTGQLRALLPSFPTVIVTRYVENPRAVPPEEVAIAVRELSNREPIITGDPAEAFQVARDRTSRDGLICVTGSLFLAAEVRALALDHEASLPRSRSSFTLNP